MTPPRTSAIIIVLLALLLAGATACCSTSGCPTPRSEAATTGAVATLASGQAGANAAARPVVTVPADTLHGHVIPDPYRWLEDFQSPRAQAWIAEQEEATRKVLDAWPGREAVRERLTQLFDIAHIGDLWLRGDRLFVRMRSGDQEQSVLYVMNDRSEKPRMLIDPDALGSGAPVTLDWWYPSRDGALLVYGTSVGGSEDSTLRVMDVNTAESLPDTIPHTRLAGVAWKPDASGFYYTRFPAPGDVPEGEEFFHRKVYYHKLGGYWRDDPVVFGEGLEMHAWPGVSISTNGRFLIAYAYYGSARNDVFVRDLQKDEGWQPIVDGLDARSYGIPIENDFYMLTRYQAPNGRIVRVDLEHPDPSNWIEIIPEGPNSISSYVYAGGKLLVDYLENAHERVQVFTKDGESLADIPLPDMASIGDWSGDWQRNEVFLNINSYLMPPTVIRYDLDTGLASTQMAVDAPIDMDSYVTEQVWYPSKDGTMISMFLVHKKDMPLDGDNPTILSGYGGFDISTTPGFARNRYLWLEHGGMYAYPNLRGGGEYGEEWHKAGMTTNKQNTFDDFIAAAEWLIDKGYTKPSRLAVWGGSNGGLLVTAFITQRPDLATAAIADVPLTDMTRFHLLYGGSIWIPEYGDPNDPEQFEYLYSYSPYHAVVDGTAYPAVYLTTGETDTRVHPSHALKMAARLEEATSSGKPILLRYERDAGHGMGSRMSTMLEEYVDYYTFLFSQLGVKMN